MALRFNRGGAWILIPCAEDESCAQLHHFCEEMSEVLGAFSRPDSLWGSMPTDSYISGFWGSPDWAL